MKENNPVKWNQDVISIFSDAYYGSLLTKSNLIEEIVIGQAPFWLLKKNKKRYILEHDREKELPIIPVEPYEKVKHNQKLYHNIINYKPAKFKPERNYEFRDLVDEFMNVKHTNPADFLLYKIIILTAYLERINFRIATEASFGKGTPINVLEHLRKDVSIINPRSMAAVEYRLTNKLMVLDEISNLESTQKKLLQEFLLLSGDFKNLYEKSTRGAKGYGTSDTYDLTHLSIGVTYNTIDHYEEHGQDDKYFDKVFQKAVMDRFLPVKLDGTIDVKQFILFDNKNKLADTFRPDYIKFVRTLEYYKYNYIEELKSRNLIKDNKFTWTMPATGSILTGRHQLTFDRICRFIALYSKDEQEFQNLSSSLLNKVRAYYIMLNKGTETLYAPFDSKPISELKPFKSKNLDEDMNIDEITMDMLGDV